jgi:two-component system, LytTR family, sensor kinase
MPSTWRPPLRWVFAAATLLGFFSALQAYRLNTLSYAKTPMTITIGVLLFLNLVYWYIPASLSPMMFRLAHRFRLDGVHKPTAFVVHAVAAVTYSAIHCAGMIGARTTVWWMSGEMPQFVSYWSYVQRQFLTNLDWTLMTYTTIVALSYALHYSKESHARSVKEAQLETRLVEARLRTLEAELHPHFLFNTLHAISSLVHTNPDAADRMISRLSDLLRLTFDRSGSAGVSLQEELEFLQKYLEIEQTRFQDRLSVRFDIDPETLDAEVPRLILQPLVENAIKHGVSPKPGSGLVQIAARRRGDGLWIEVSDNGVGLSAGARARLRSGVGLSNTRDRLQCLYGTAHRIEFSDEAKGLAVRLEIPFHRAPTASHAAAFQVA